jgi:hypothetical protein
MTIFLRRLELRYSGGAYDPPFRGEGSAGGSLLAPGADPGAERDGFSSAIFIVL